MNLSKFIFLLYISLIISSSEGNVFYQKPNIIIVVLDDIGWNDLQYNSPLSKIPTPIINALVDQGISFTQHYTHSLCTPSRGSLLTGRYNINLGLNNVLLPGTPAGLPDHIPTLPMLLKYPSISNEYVKSYPSNQSAVTQASKVLGYHIYETSMVGKWHLGHAQRKMTPVGRGFDTFTGLFMWDIDSYTKQMYELPWEPPIAIDWIIDHSDGTYEHYAEPLHSMEAISITTEDVIRKHANRNPFRYDHSSTNSNPMNESDISQEEAFTAAHSPLQPLPRHVNRCAHIPHILRRDFCGMVVGIDETIGNLTSNILEYLPSKNIKNNYNNPQQQQPYSNTILIALSDNGGSTWFGGMNEPLRGTKSTPLEGGVRVPAFIIDFTEDQRYLGGNSSSSSNVSFSELQSIIQQTISSYHNNTIDSNKIDVNTTTTINTKKKKRRVFHGLMHVSDWVPTILAYTNLTSQVDSNYIQDMDGYDFSKILYNTKYEDNDYLVDNKDSSTYHSNPTCHIRRIPNDTISPRTNILIELYDKNASVLNEDLVAYRWNDYKLIKGIIRDPNYYRESTINLMNMSSPSIYTYIVESASIFLENTFGKSANDNFHIMMVHDYLYSFFSSNQRKGIDTTLYLFNIIEDPCEQVNLVNNMTTSLLAHDIIKQIEIEINLIVNHPNKPKIQPLDIIEDLTNVWSKTHVPGNCSMNKIIPTSQCRFTHTWVSDDENPMSRKGLMTYTAYKNKKIVKYAAIITITIVICSVIITWIRSKF